jgi:hypothetical protein
MSNIRHDCTGSFATEINFRNCGNPGRYNNEFSALILISCICVISYKPASKCHLSFYEDGVARTANGTTFSFPWQSFSKLTETKSFFLLYVSSFDAHIIPKRIFTDNAEMESFKQFVRANAGDSLLNE